MYNVGISLFCLPLYMQRSFNFTLKNGEKNGIICHKMCKSTIQFNVTRTKLISRQGFYNYLKKFPMHYEERNSYLSCFCKYLHC